jgi:NhaP-type Na+/H+ or K+/H+ antiporter
MLTNVYIWYLVIGLLLLLMALLQPALKRLPVSSAIVYLLLGVLLGPQVLGWLRIDALGDSHLLERATEAVMLIALFTVGLKMRVPLGHRDWMTALRLVVGALLLTIIPLALLAKFALGMPPAAGLLLAAILSPTDPVLASDVQLRDPSDRDRVRFSLTVEGGLNDGIALPFVILGLTWLAAPAHPDILHWAVWELLWPLPAGIAGGWACAYAVGKLTLRMRRRDRAAIGLDEFVALGVIGIAYALTSLLHGNGFLAVFAAGLAMRRFEMQDTGDSGADLESLEHVEARAPPEAPARLMSSLLRFNEQLEHILEVAVVLLIGALLRPTDLTGHAVLIAAALFLLVRPLSVGLTLAGSAVPRAQQRLMGWFGIRGVGSLYYLMFAVNQGLERELAPQLVAIVVPVIAASIIAHGVSATPLMERYSRIRAARRRR